MKYTEKELQQERWKPIFGYDGIYEVSDLGRVRSKKYGRWKVMRPKKFGRGYFGVCLRKDGKAKNFLVHRLVAQAFIPNDNIFNTEVNHIDECKQNNKVSNIEWCDRHYNLSYNGLRKRQYHPQPKRSKLKDLYDKNLTYEENLEIFRAKGIECCVGTLYKLRKDLGLTKKTMK